MRTLFDVELSTLYCSCNAIFYQRNKYWKRCPLTVCSRAVEILGCSIFEGSKLHESNGWDIEGVRGRPGTGKCEGGICD